MLSANAVIYELQNALNMATEYIKKQDAEIKALKEVGSIRDMAKSKNVKISEAGLVSVNGTASLLGISPSTVSAMLEAHELPDVKTRGRRQVHIDDIEQYINNQRRKAI